MSELSQRARELAEQMGGLAHGEEFSFPSMVNLKVIEQGLMREWEEAAKIAESYLVAIHVNELPLKYTTLPKEVAKQLRSCKRCLGTGLTETSIPTTGLVGGIQQCPDCKGTGKRATPRGGE